MHPPKDLCHIMNFKSRPIQSKLQCLWNVQLQTFLSHLHTNSAVAFSVLLLYVWTHKAHFPLSSLIRGVSLMFFCKCSPVRKSAMLPGVLFTVFRNSLQVSFEHHCRFLLWQLLVSNAFFAVSQKWKFHVKHSLLCPRRAHTKIVFDDVLWDL